jgi:hypothetical protein
VDRLYQKLYFLDADGWDGFFLGFGFFLEFDGGRGIGWKKEKEDE